MLCAIKLVPIARRIERKEDALPGERVIQAVDLEDAEHRWVQAVPVPFVTRAGNDKSNG